MYEEIYRKCTAGVCRLQQYCRMRKNSKNLFTLGLKLILKCYFLGGVLDFF
jgi:hypothetical protein